MKTVILPLVCILLFTLVSCSNPQVQNGNNPSLSFNLDSAKLEIQQQNELFQTAFEHGDSTGLAALFTTDGKMMMPGAPSVTGRSAIASAVSPFMKMKIVRKAQTIDVWGNGDLIAEEGAVILLDDKGNELDHAKTLVVWKREDGQWKMFRDMWNSDLSPKPMK